MAVKISTNVRVLILTMLFYMLWMGWILAFVYHPPNIVIFWMIFFGLYIVFTALYLWGRRSGFLITLVWSIVAIVSFGVLFISKLTAGALADPIFLPAYTLNLAFPVVVLIFSYRAYREFKATET